MGTISTSDALFGSFDELDARNEKYERSVFHEWYPPTFSELELLVNYPLQNRVAQVSVSQEKTDFVIDGTLRIRAPSDIFRETKVEEWTTVKSNLKTVAWMGGAITVAGAVGAALTMASPVVMTACAVGAFANLILTCVAAHRVSQANDQIDLWNQSPAQQVAEERSLAYKNGFGYIYTKQLKSEGQAKTGVLQPFEVNFLYQKYFPTYCLKLLNQNPATNNRWMLDFLTNNPLSSKLITYAMGEIPPNLQLISQDFRQLEKILNDIQTQFARIKAEVRQNASETIDAYNAKRNLSLLPLQLARNHYISTARDTLNEKLKSARSEDDRRKAENTFEAESSKYELYYILAATPINLYFDNQIQQTRVERDRNIRELNSSEADRLVAYYPSARNLMEIAHLVWTQPYVYVQQTFPQYYYQPSAPSFANIPSFRDQVFHQAPPTNWDNAQRAGYDAYINYLRQNQQGAW